MHLTRSPFLNGALGLLFVAACAAPPAPHPALAPRRAPSHSQLGGVIVLATSRPMASATHAPPAEDEDTEGSSPFLDGIHLSYGTRLCAVGSDGFLSTERLLLPIQGDQVVLEPKL